MLQRTPAVGNLPEAFGMVGRGRSTARIGVPNADRQRTEPPAGIIRGRMAQGVGRWPPAATTGATAPCSGAARAAARRFADRCWRAPYPKAVKCLRDDLPARFRYLAP